MKKTTKRVKLPPLARVMKRADHLWSILVLLDGAIPKEPKTPCMVCGVKPATTAHHIYHKGANGRFRYDRRNGLPICTGCHLRERYNPTPVAFAAMNYMGIAKWIELGCDVQEWRGAYRWTRERLNLVVIALEGMIASAAIPEDIRADASTPVEL